MTILQTLRRQFPCCVCRTITNLISVDTQRLLDNIPYLNVLWGAPLKIIVAMVLIYRELGK